MENSALNTLPLSAYGGYIAGCRCGRTHTVRTADILFGSGVLADVGKAAQRIVPVGVRVLLVTDEAADKAAADRAERLMSRAGYRVRKHIIAPLATIENADPSIADEDTKLVVGAGGGSVCDVAKYLGEALKIPVMIIATLPTTAGWLAPSAALTCEGFIELYKVAPPRAVLLDTDTLIGLPSETLACGFGEIMSRAAALFDWRFASLITGEKYCSYLAEQATAVMDAALERLSGVERGGRDIPAILAELNLRLSAVVQMTDNSRLLCGGDTQILHALTMLARHEDRQLRLQGETSFLLSGILLRVYRFALSHIADAGFLAPPDNNLRIEKLVEYFGVTEARAAVKVQPYLRPETMRLYEYKLKEYRGELLSLLDVYEKKLDAARKIFRRLYDDDGYALLNYLGSDEVALSMGLAPDVREKFTMLTYLKHTGFLEKYIV